jgi:hypothetical protein
MAPRTDGSTNRQAEPEVGFRIVHLTQDGLYGTPVAAYREQDGRDRPPPWGGPKGAFVNGNFGALTRRVPTDRVPTDRVVTAIPPLGGSPKPPEEPPPLTPVFTRSPCRPV